MGDSTYIWAECGDMGGVHFGSVADFDRRVGRLGFLGSVESSADAFDLRLNFDISFMVGPAAVDSTLR